MRILQVVEAASGGVGKHVADLSIELAKRGHKVCVVYSDGRIDDRFRLFLKELDSLGGSSQLLPMSKLPSPKDIGLARELSVLAKDFDVLHGHAFKGGMLARLAKRPKIFYTPHGYFTMYPGGGFKRPIFTALEKYLSKVGTTINVSQYEKDHAGSLGIDTSRCQVIANGVAQTQQLERAQVRKTWGIPEDAVVFGFIGRFESPKRPDLATAAFAQVESKFPHAHLVMIGSGSLEASAKPTGARVHWLGPLDATALYGALDAVVLATDSEGMPYVVLEGLAAGVPTIATRYRGAEEVISDGHSGLLSPLGDAEGLAKNFERALDPDELATLKLGAAAAYPNFSLATMVDRTISLYEA